MTFACEADGDAYATRLKALLSNNIVPHERQPEQRIADLGREYQREAHLPSKDVRALRVIVRKRGATRLGSIHVAWVDDWISEMKLIQSEINPPQDLRYFDFSVKDTVLKTSAFLTIEGHKTKSNLNRPRFSRNRDVMEMSMSS